MKQSPSFLTIAVGAIILISCDTKEVERLRTENDSLRRELETRYSVVSTMRDIKLLIDSIDMNRNALHADLQEGTTFEDFTDRMRDINTYVVKTESKLDTIQQELKSSRGVADAYLMMLEGLKGELSDRQHEINALGKRVREYQSENKGLVKTVRLQESQLVEMKTQIETKQQELSLIEAKVTEMVDNFKVSEAEAFYARAKAVEEAANRTKLAPNKKRETYREAMELYRKALSLGKKEAQQDISTLEKKIR
jgi:chromosome segregation ATPase